MKERVNNDSCLSYYLFADHYHINDLLDICIDFIQINTKDFLINSIYILLLLLINRFSRYTVQFINNNSQI